MSEIVKACAGIALGCIGFAMVPLFGMPLEGCAPERWLELSPACGHWPEALRGFLFVAPMAVLAPVRWMLPVIAIIILLAFAIVGGAGGFASGQNLYLATAGLEFFKEGYPLMIGGLVAMLPWMYRRQRATRNAA